MAAMSGNNANYGKTSMAAELLSIINVEEYVTEVEMFHSTAYLNKIELSSVKKMVSGKLWLDSRKFVSRQNNVIVNGLFALFGATLGKSASDIRAEACDFLLDADHVELRKILRRSVNESGRTYSKWITKLSNDIYPCDEFGLFLLSFTFKRHVLVILADKVWCTFKTGRMTTFEKICKSDHVLVWLGEDRYCEAKPLQQKTGTSISNIAEWQLLAESVDLLHSKAKNRARRVEKGNASIKTPTKHVSISSPTRELSKRDRKRSIDYKQLHEDGVFEPKKRHTEKYPPRSSGPSDLRLEAQKQIVENKNSTSNRTRRSVATANYIPIRTVSVSDTMSDTGKTGLRNIKQERTTYFPLKPVKPEPGIHLRRRINPSDKDRPWKFVHVSGRPCNQGGDRDCNSQSENEDEPDIHSLPDLPRVPDPPLVPNNSISGNIRPGAAIATTQQEVNTIDLTSPPAIQRLDYVPTTSEKRRTTNLGDLLCTLNFDLQVGKDATSTTNQTRKVATLMNDTRSEEINKATKTSKTPQACANVPLTNNTRKVVTVIPFETNTPKTTAPVSNATPTTSTRKVATSSLLDDVTSRTGIITLEAPQLLPTSNSDSPTSPLAKETELFRQVATTLTSVNAVTDTITNASTDVEPANDPGRSRNEPNSMFNDDNSNQTRESAALSSTPRSVVTDPEAVELETADALLQLGSLNSADNTDQDDFDAGYDNSKLLPVDAAPLKDVARELADKEPSLKQNKTNNEKVTDETLDSTDSDKTVDYTSKPSQEDNVTSPKRSIKYKQYGIKRSSPTTGPNRNRRCPYCDTICHSKREWNIHHKTEHTKVQCPDCRKLFPTPDALSRHRYIHNEAHRFKCAICDKICAFQSDLDQHMAKHNKDKIWYCSYDDCTRDFKRKSDLTAHEVVHTGEDFICEFPKCGFTRKDPRLVKRHQRVHTKEAKVECHICGEKFVFYMQMKRHRERIHKNVT